MRANAILYINSILLITVFCVQSLKQSLQDEYVEFENDMPLQSDFHIYVTPLRNITKFYLNNIERVSISVAFGLFIANVHLGKCLRDTMPTFVREELLEIFYNNQEVLTYFHKSIREDNRISEKYLKVSELFVNISDWIDRLEELHPPKYEVKVSRELQKLKLEWKEYLEVANIRRVYKWIPTPLDSDSCLESLSESYKEVGYSRTSCVVDENCYEILEHGSDIAYALSHRIRGCRALLLLMAHHSKSCSIFSAADDRQLLATFCAMSYVEAEFISRHDYGLLDLMLEHMAVCALDGRTQFLRRSWLSDIVKFQTRYGCFSQVLDSTTSPQSPENYVEPNENNDLMDGLCNSHTSALAASVLAAAVRYTLRLNN